jgi:hypothetical protein
VPAALWGLSVWGVGQGRTRVGGWGLLTRALPVFLNWLINVPAGQTASALPQLHLPNLSTARHSLHCVPPLLIFRCSGGVPAVGPSAGGAAVSRHPQPHCRPHHGCVRGSPLQDRSSRAPSPPLRSSIWVMRRFLSPLRPCLLFPSAGRERVQHQHPGPMPAATPLGAADTGVPAQNGTVHH